MQSLISCPLPDDLITVEKLAVWEEDIITATMHNKALHECNPLFSWFKKRKCDILETDGFGYTVTKPTEMLSL